MRVVTRNDMVDHDEEDYYGDNNDDDIDVEDPEDEDDEDNQPDAVQGFFLHKEPVYTVSMHPLQDSIVVSGGGDDASYVWNTHSDSVVASGFSFDGQYLATGGMDGRLFVYKSTTGEQILELDGPAEVTWLNWHPRGNALLVAVPSGQCMNVFTGHSGSISCGQFSPDGKSIVSGGEEGNLYNWDPRTAAVKQVFRADDARFLNGSSVTSVGVHGDSQVVLAGGQDGTASLVHLGSGKILGSVSKAEDSIESIGFSSHLPIASVASIDGTIALWDITAMRLRQTFRHPKGVTKTIFLKTKPLLLSASLDKTVRLWDLRTGTFQRSFYGHSGPILDMSIGASETSFVTCGEDGSSQVFLIE
ncbi:WD40-repeat-containing domain protein [Obelidium mucronatum]|nr:WD40-repeat-containing domain protein [Obelidium mucronatum]